MFKRFWSFLKSFVSNKKLYSFKCGHTSALKVEVKALKETRTSNLKSDQLDHCPECLAHMAIPCGKCGGAIFPFEPVGSTLLQTPVEGAHIRGSVWITICTKCCEMGVFDAIGTWKPPGHIDTKDLPYTIS